MELDAATVSPKVAATELPNAISDLPLGATELPKDAASELPKDTASELPIGATVLPKDAATKLTKDAVPELPRDAADVLPTGATELLEDAATVIPLVAAAVLPPVASCAAPDCVQKEVALLKAPTKVEHHLKQIFLQTPSPPPPSGPSSRCARHSLAFAAPWVTRWPAAWFSRPGSASAARPILFRGLGRPTPSGAVAALSASTTAAGTYITSATMPTSDIQQLLSLIISLIINTFYSNLGLFFLLTRLGRGAGGASSCVGGPSPASSPSPSGRRRRRPPIVRIRPPVVAVAVTRIAVRDNRFDPPQSGA